MSENRHIEDDEYFQKYTKAHLDRGAKTLYSELNITMIFFLLC